MKEQISGQEQLFRAAGKEPVIEVSKAEPHKEDVAQSAEAVHRSAILKLKMEISDTASKLEIMEKQDDDGVLPPGAYPRLQALREKLASQKSELAEIDIPTSIFEVLSDEFIDRFEHYGKYLEKPDSDEALRFLGIIRLIRKNPELHQRALKNPRYKEYIENLDK